MSATQVPAENTDEGSIYSVMFCRMNAPLSVFRDALIARVGPCTAGNFDVLGTFQNADGTHDVFMVWVRDNAESDFHESAHTGGHDGTPDAARAQLQRELDDGSSVRTTEAERQRYSLASTTAAINAVSLRPDVLAHFDMCGRTWNDPDLALLLPYRFTPAESFWSNPLSTAESASEPFGSDAENTDDNDIVATLIADRDVAIALIRAAAERHNLMDVLNIAALLDER